MLKNSKNCVSKVISIDNLLKAAVIEIIYFESRIFTK